MELTAHKTLDACFRKLKLEIPGSKNFLVKD